VPSGRLRPAFGRHKDQFYAVTVLLMRRRAWTRAAAQSFDEIAEGYDRLGKLVRTSWSTSG